MKNLFILLSISTTIAIISCNKIDNPIPKDFVDTNISNWDDSSYTVSSPTMRKIMIEEFTGHLCTYCPDGAREIERLDSIYGNQLIPMSIHAGGFADVPAGGAGFDANGDGIMDYTTDFTNPSGEEYYTTFGVASNPAATVSRLNNANITGLSNWQTDIDLIKNDIPVVSIGLSTMYNDSSRTAKAIVTTEWLTSSSGNYNLQIYLAEDSISAWQLDNSVHVENYIHRHVFRTPLNGTWGTSIPSSNAGDIDTQEFAVNIDPEWDKNHCIIIAHIYKVGPDYEIMQAEELHVITH